MRYISLFFILLFVTSCGLSTTVIPITVSPSSSSTTSISTQDIFPTLMKSQTNTSTSLPSSAPTNISTATRTPYPIPEGILTREEMQQRIQDWINVKIIIYESDRLLDEKTGKPIRLGILDKPLFGEVIFIFYNLGYTVIEDENGIPFLLNIVGFEDGNGERFTFPFHNGRLYNQDRAITLQEFNGKRINYGEIISNEKLFPSSFILKSKDLVGLINGGVTSIGSDDRGDMGDIYMQSSEETTNYLTNFLYCDNCKLENVPKSLQSYINQIPTIYSPTLPYIWVYWVAY